MNIAQLTEIVSTADSKYIKEKLKEAGYTDCGRSKVQKDLNLAALFLGFMSETEEYINEQTSLIFKGALYTGVQNHESFEFIVVASYNSENPYPVTLNTWAKRAYVVVVQPSETAVAEDQPEEEEQPSKKKKKKIKKTKVVTTVEETTEVEPEFESEFDEQIEQ